MVLNMEIVYFEYWTPTLIGDKKIETMDMETEFIEEEFQDEEEIVKD